MSTSTDSTFAVQKKRRRSSLFVDRPASLINDSTDTASTASANNANEMQLVNYLAQLKSCKRSWVIHEKKLKSQLNSATAVKTQCKEYEDIQNNYLDYLDEEDRKFMEEMSLLLDSSAYEKITDAVKEKMQLLSARYVEDKLHCSLIFENINQAYRQCIVNKFHEFQDRNEIGISDGLGEICVSENAPQVFEYDSDLSEFEE